MLIQFRNYFKPLMIMLAMFAFVSCQKDIKDSSPVPPDNETPDLSSKVSSSVSGFVMDENNLPVDGATIRVGTASTSTDDYGYFEVRNVDVVKTAAVVTAEAPGYFKGIKTYMASAGKKAFFRIKLIPKTISGTISSNTGGNVTLTNGLIVALPADAVVNAASGTAYSGTINVASHWIDPTSSELSHIMPGDLRGLDNAGALKMLTTYGMAAVELTGAGGELLQIKDGKKATLTMPLPSSLQGSAPASIPLWSFNESNGLWKEEGSAAKTGNSYVGEVSHFSFWNCDVPANYVQVNMNVVDGSGNPVPHLAVKISVVGGQGSAWGYTDSSGYVAGAIPANASLLLEIFGTYGCGSAIHTQNFSSSNTDISLGNITITPGTNAATVSGTVTNCTASPVTNGYVVLSANNLYYRYAVDNSGAFSFPAYLCNGATSATIVAEDYNSMQQSTPLNFTLSPGANNVGNIEACGTSTTQFITWSIDGGVTSTTLSAPADSVFHSGNGTTTMAYIGGSNNANTYINFAIEMANPGVGTVQTLLNFNTGSITQQVSVVPPANVVNITEYGPVGGFIAGNFSATVMSTSPAATYPVTCSFRVRRNF